MKTITGNTVRIPLSSYGTKVDSITAACAAVGFTIVSEPAARLSTGLAIPNTQNLYRSDDGTCLGQHTPQFTYFQPCDSLQTLEKARNLVGGSWQTVAAPKGGRQIAAFCGIEAKITAPKRGDKVGLSIAYFDRYDGGGKARLQLFANVLACENGMTRAESLVSFSEKHNGSIKDRFAALEFKLLVNLQTQIEEMQNMVTALDNKAMTGNEVEAFARVLLPTPDENNVPVRTENARAEIVNGFSRGRGNVGRTRWDAFNSVTEFLDWNSTFRETEFSREDNRFESLVSGSAARTRNRAMELLLN